jgi:hypothetical protein
MNSSKATTVMPSRRAASPSVIVASWTVPISTSLILTVELIEVWPDPSQQHLEGGFDLKADRSVDIGAGQSIQDVECRIQSRMLQPVLLTCEDDCLGQLMYG